MSTLDLSSAPFIPTGHIRVDAGAPLLEGDKVWFLERCPRTGCRFGGFVPVRVLEGRVVHPSSFVVRANPSA
jgi:hypothetical protein